MEVTAYVVWIDSLNRIASFHEEKGYDRMEFQQHDYFISYLCQLSDNKYRFQ